MTELEKVEKLIEKSNVSYAEAKDALAASNGDILDALIYLENRGKAIRPQGGGFYSGSGSAAPDQQVALTEVDKRSSEGKRSSSGSNADTKSSSSSGTNSSKTQDSGENSGDSLKRFGMFCATLIRKGNNNYLEATKDDEKKFSCPITIVVLFVLFFFWVTIPLFIISLFFGFRYHFRGEELGRESINNAMDNAADAVDEVKKSFKSGANKEASNNNGSNSSDANGNSGGE